MAEWVDAGEAAARLGVKPATLYAYVSRGQLRRRTAADGRRSEYHAGDVAALAVRGRRARPVRPSDIVIPTAVTRLDADGPIYRGLRAVDAAGTVSFEAVAARLWQVEDDARWQPRAAAVTAAREVAGEHTAERLPALIAAVRSADPLRGDLRTLAIVAAVRSLAAAAATVGPDSPGIHGPPTFAAGLAHAWPTGATADAVALVDASLVLLADHELAASTLAVRIAASERADPYAALLAGVAVVSGTRHGGTSRPLERTLAAVAAGVPPDAALAEHATREGQPLGFGHPLYPNGDPRARRLLTLLWDHAPATAELLRGVLAAAGERGSPPPTIDVALAGVTAALGAPVGAGELLFTLARMAGWTAHALEQYADPELLRPRAVYVGDPGSG